jgi:FtsP/CotA-like multicopper oxidase with cupredoxin domain
VPRPTRALEDTIGIGPNETARLAVRYTAPGDWMFHCQIPEHAERGMMGDLMVLP